MQLLIGNKNYSSWSLRGWLMLKAFGLEFKEIKLSLFTDPFYQKISELSPAAKVPVLVDGEIRVWDSLAICEYINETYLKGEGWPSAAADRALARAVVCEMHSGYTALRNEMPMNCRALRLIELSDEAKQDVFKIDELWQQLILQYQQDGDWLFGRFTIADVYFAPVVLRFVTYGVELSEPSQQYMKKMRSLPALQEWIDDALQETEIVPEDEAGVAR